MLTGFEVFKFTDGTVNNNDAIRLVDDLFYYSKYHDVWNAHVDADAHFVSFGRHEGRDPNVFFSTVVYRSANPDVAAAGVNPLDHFDAAGWLEGRVPSIHFDPAQYLAANPDVAAAGVNPLRHYLQFGYQEGRQPFAATELVAANGFDFVYYLNHNPDVAAAGVDPFQHFQTFGWQEGRNPNALFDTNGYLSTYGDVAAAHVNPLDHYNQFGWHEGRDPSVGFDTTSYLAAYAGRGGGAASIRSRISSSSASTRAARPSRTACGGSKGREQVREPLIACGMSGFVACAGLCKAGRMGLARAAMRRASRIVRRPSKILGHECDYTARLEERVLKYDLLLLPGHFEHSFKRRIGVSDEGNQVLSPRPPPPGQPAILFRTAWCRVVLKVLVPVAGKPTISVLGAQFIGTRSVAIFKGDSFK